MPTKTIGQILAASPRLAPTPESKNTDQPSGWRPTLNEYEPTIREAVDACARFIADMEKGIPPYWLTITGENGCGKTTLARQTFAFAKANCNPGRHSLWISGAGIRSEENRRPNCEWFTADTFSQRMGAGEWDLPEYLRPDYLVTIDDLGRSRDTANATFTDGLCRLADQRMHRWMLWTTNLTLAEIASRLDPRIASRLIRDENRLITIKAGDYALRP